MYYIHLGYQTSIFGKNCAYYIRIFMVYLYTRDIVLMLVLVSG